MSAQSVVALLHAIEDNAVAVRFQDQASFEAWENANPELAERVFSVVPIVPRRYLRFWLPRREQPQTTHTEH